jgi:glucose/arabinose dehydrogenase
MRTLHVLAPIFLLVTAPAPAGEKPFGMERRTPWNDSHVIGSPDPPSPYKVVRAFPKLTIKQPLTLTPEPGANRLFILQHLNFWAGPGRLLAVDDDQDVSRSENLLEIDALAVGVALHPNYKQNGYLYIGMSGLFDGRKMTRVIRYTVDIKSTRRIDPRSQLVIIGWDSNGHDGGDLAFGNDGYLYVSSGDGSSGSDAFLTGQRIDDLQGAVLRIDVDHPDPGRNYGIPQGNPFVDRKGARGEVWAYGLRNPWRLSYDRDSGQLWVGQNGQDLWEQVYLIKKGANYGWSLSEGSHVFEASRHAGPDPISPPTAEHPHSEARSLTGGRVYRGGRRPELVGAYIYGDWSTGRVWGIKHDGTNRTWHRELVDTPFNITGFGTDHAGERYIIDQAGGAFYRLEPTTEADRPTQPFPTKLSQTGLFASVPDHKPHPAALVYQVNAPQWADGATIERFAALPGLERIKQEPQLNAGGSWTLPNGSVLVQTLSLNRYDDATRPSHKRMETRLLVRQQGEWTGYSYRWNPGQTDAELVGASGAGGTFEVPDPEAPGGRREQDWRFPSRTECLVCHSRAAGFVLSFTPLQLDRDHDFGGTKDNQLRAFEHIGVFHGALPGKRDDQPRLINPYDTAGSLEARVRSYLHVNCSTCHVNEGGGNSTMELGLTTPANAMRLIDEIPNHDRFDITDARRVAAGSPARSVLYQRISRRGTGQMPPLGSTEVDQTAVKLFGDWIRSLPPPGR